MSTVDAGAVMKGQLSTPVRAPIVPHQLIPCTSVLRAADLSDKLKLPNSAVAKLLGEKLLAL
jgi:hypothetical protein